MTIEEAFELIENRDYPEGLRRRLAPGYSLFHVNRYGEVVNVIRFKRLPTEEDQFAAIKENRGCVQFSGNPGMYASAAELRTAIEQTMWLFEKMKPRED